MKLDKFTIKLQEALQEAISFATESWHQEVVPEHLFYTSLRQEGNIIAGVLDKLGLPTFSIIKIIEEFLQKKPSVAGGNTQVYLSIRLNRLLNNAEKEAKSLKDEFTSGDIAVQISVIASPEGAKQSLF